MKRLFSYWQLLNTYYGHSFINLVYKLRPIKATIRRYTIENEYRSRDERYPPVIINLKIYYAMDVLRKFNREGHILKLKPKST